tara:strand:+ start:3270 stop:3524 length:255 start_codon:yes stop_codon:yes gene_type:complete
MVDGLGLLGTSGGGRKRRYKTGKRKSKAGKRKTRRVRRKSMKGGSSMANALLPLGLLSLQQFFMNKSRKNKSIIPKKIKKTLKL